MPEPWQSAVSASITDWGLTGDIFGTPLAIEGMMACFLEAIFVGLFFFGWDHLSKLQHLIVTGLVALGTNLSALWILIANGWMQHPVGAKFDLATMSMQVTHFTAVPMNPNAQNEFVHTISVASVAIERSRGDTKLAHARLYRAMMEKASI